MSDPVIEKRPAKPKAEESAERITAQRASGMSVRQFCQEQGLTEHSFYAWRKRRQPAGWAEGGGDPLAGGIVPAPGDSRQGLSLRHPARLAQPTGQPGRSTHPCPLGRRARLKRRGFAVRILSLSAEQRLALRRRISARLLQLHRYLLELQPKVLPKSPSGAAVRYALNQWAVLPRFVEDGELEIDNGATERANRDIALGRGNWTFFGSDSGGKTAPVLRSLIASCKRSGVEPFAWFRDVLSRITEHSVTRLGELLPHNWKPLDSPAPV